MSGNVSEPFAVVELRKVIQERRLTKDFLEADECRNLLTALRRSIHSDAESDVWSGLSVAGRAASVSKPMEKVFVPIIDERLQMGLPPFTPLQDEENRCYLAKAIQGSSAPEAIEIAFSEIVREVSENARRTWVGVALCASNSKEEFLTRIRCLILRFDGVILSLEWKEALWDKFVTAAPRPRTPSEQQ